MAELGTMVLGCATDPRLRCLRNMYCFVLCCGGLRALRGWVGPSQLSSISGSDTESDSDDDAPHGADVTAASPRVCFEDPGENLSFMR